MAAKARSAKVWVSGAFGMLGHATRRALEARGHQVVATGRALDIAEPHALYQFCERERPTHLINCAAMTAVDRCESDIEEAERINALGPRMLGECAQNFGIVAAHVSTDYVFGAPSQKPWREDDRCAPLSQYGKTKLAGEQAFSDATGHAGIVVRTSWLFGADGQNFVATMLKLMAERKTLEIVDDQRGRPTATQDLAQALLRLVGLDEKTFDEPQAGGVYHFANAGEVSWFQFAQQIFSEAQRLGLALTCEEIVPTTSDRFVRPAPRPTYSVLDTQKVTSALGYTPRPFVEPLHEYVSEYASTQ